MRRELPSIATVVWGNTIRPFHFSRIPERIGVKIRRELDHLQGHGSYVKVQKDETRERAIFLERESARKHPGQGF